MAYTYIYKSADGTLVSSTKDGGQIAPADFLTGNGLEVVTGLPALDTSHAWDAATHSVISVTPPVPMDNVEPHEFIDYFTAAETVAIKNSTDAQVVKFLLRLSVAKQVNMNDAVVQGGVQYLAAIGLIASARASQIIGKQIQTT